MYIRSELRTKIPKSDMDTASRNRGADIGYEPVNLGCLVLPITRKNELRCA